MNNSQSVASQPAILVMDDKENKNDKQKFIGKSKNQNGIIAILRFIHIRSVPINPSTQCNAMRCDTVAP